MRHIAFALDPDEYWVEIIGQNPVEQTENVTTTELQTYRMNHTVCWDSVMAQDRRPVELT